MKEYLKYVYFLCIISLSISPSIQGMENTANTSNPQSDPLPAKRPFKRQRSLKELHEEGHGRSTSFMTLKEYSRRQKEKRINEEKEQKTNENEVTCAICQPDNQLTKSTQDLIFITLPCKHQIHKTCLEKCIKADIYAERPCLCALCRKPLPNSLTEPFLPKDKNPALNNLIQLEEPRIQSSIHLSSKITWPVIISCCVLAVALLYYHESKELNLKPKKP